MKSSYGKYILFWSLIIAFLTIFYTCSETLTPFTIALVLAYILRPIMNFCMVFLKSSKALAAAIILISVYIIIFAFIWYACPFIGKQIIGLYNTLKSLDVGDMTYEFLNSVKGYIPESVEHIINELLLKIPAYFVDFFTKMASSLLNSTGAAVNILLVIVLSPFISFFFLKDGDLIKQKALVIVPSKYKDFITYLTNEVDSILGRFFKLQLIVVAIWMVYYTVGFLLIDIDSGAILGIMTGILSFVPYFGIAAGFVVSSLVTILQFSDYYSIIYIVALFLLGQLLDIFVISAKITSKALEIHPALILFSLLISAQLFGIWGIFLALPITLIIKMLLRIAIVRYGLK